MSKKTVNRIGVQVSEEMMAHLEQIRVNDGLLSRSEVIRAAISFYKEKKLDNYKVIAQQRLNRSKGSKAQAAIDKVAQNERDEAKKGASLRKYRDICQKLGGTEVQEGDQEVCRYIHYEEVAGGVIDKADKVVPLEMLSEDLIATQYVDLLGNTGDEVKAKLTTK